MILTNTLTKKALELIIKEYFSKFGSMYSCVMLDSLKFLGFSYATQGGISISIEDLKTPEVKEEVLNETESYIEQISNDWYSGKVSENERFQGIINQWTYATESLKNRIVAYYQQFDPTNNLYIMAFSGARGNMSQVRQLIGMRGLMSDQEGNIIDLPIQKNFREGLSSLDYLISAYGARKGVVDTALKTADSGYLTRRLIYVAQDLIIRDVDCKTQRGLFIDNNTNVPSNLIGRYLLSSQEHSEEIQDLFDKVIDESTLDRLEKIPNLKFSIRSPLTCDSTFSLCQKCYGWDLSKNNLISLGEAIGIIAAQSIGEPGTQLTMRTFHTGGIFTSELVDQNRAPFSGQFSFVDSSQLDRLLICRTPEGVIAKKTEQNIAMKILTWQGKEEIFDIPGQSYLYKTIPGFLKKGELISEALTNSSNLGLKRLKAVHSPIEGQITFQDLKSKKIDFKNLKICTKESSLWIHSGKFLAFPKQAKLNPKNSNFLNSDKSIAKLKVISPISGFLHLEKSRLTIFQDRKKIELRFNGFDFPAIRQNHIQIKINSLSKNYQFVDLFSILAYFYFIPKLKEKVYSFTSFFKNNLKSFFFITEADVFEMSFDEFRKDYHSLQLKSLLTPNQKISKNLINKESGILIKKDGLRLTFQKVFPIFLNNGSLINQQDGNFICQNDILAYSVNYRQQTKDIVQGLPKVEDIIEARPPEKPCFLMPYPVIIVKLIGLDERELEELNEEDRLKSLISDDNSLTISHKYKTISSNTSYFSYRIVKKEVSSFEKKKGKMKGKDDDFITPPGTVISLGNSLIRRNRNENFIAKELGMSKRRLYLRQDLPHMSLVEIVEGITEGLVNPHDLIRCLSIWHKNLEDSVSRGCKTALVRFQLILVNSVQGVYSSQGVDISSKHIEVVARQMTNRARVLEASYHLPFCSREIIKFASAFQIAKVLEDSNLSKNFYFDFEPIVLSSTAASLSKSGFLAAAGFQETKRVLTRGALEGHKDWLRGLKECIITGRLIPAGTSFLAYKSYLDTIIFYKDEEKVEDEEIKDNKIKAKEAEEIIIEEQKDFGQLLAESLPRDQSFSNEKKIKVVKKIANIYRNKILKKTTEREEKNE